MMVFSKDKMRAVASWFISGLTYRGTSLSPLEQEILSEYPPFGINIYGRNMDDSPEQVIQMLKSLASISNPRPIFPLNTEGSMSHDHLGKYFGVSWPSPLACGAKGINAVRESARLMGLAAGMLGFDITFAPVVDLALPGKGAVVFRDRAFHRDVDCVVEAGKVSIEVFKDAGLAICLKHFPGGGRGEHDTHIKPTIIDADKEEFFKTDLKPFVELLPLVDSVMLNHATYPFLSGNVLPASQSPEILAMLRETLNFNGVAITDNLVMDALKGHFAQRAQKAALAGNDLLLQTRGSDPLCKKYVESLKLVSRVWEKGEHRHPRLSVLRDKCLNAAKPAYSEAAWKALGRDVRFFASKFR